MACGSAKLKTVHVWRPRRRCCGARFGPRICERCRVPWNMKKALTSLRSEGSTDHVWSQSIASAWNTRRDPTPAGQAQSDPPAAGPMQVWLVSRRLERIRRGVVGRQLLQVIALRHRAG